jgi:hypothetical protein
MAKASKVEVARRVAELIPLRLAGVPFHAILRFASDRGWPIGRRQLENYVRRCDDQLACHLERDGKRLLDRHLVIRDHLYHLALESGDLRTALAAVKDAAAIRGVYAPRKYTNTDLSGENPATPLSPAEREALLAKLHERAGAPPPPPTPPGFAADANGQTRPIHPSS